MGGRLEGVEWLGCNVESRLESGLFTRRTESSRRLKGIKIMIVGFPLNCWFNAWFTRVTIPVLIVGGFSIEVTFDF